MNLKTPGSLLILGMAIAPGCLGLSFRATGEVTAIVEICDEFDCLLVSETEQNIYIQCVFSAGAIFLLDIDDDGVSDGENSRGTFVDNILASFPLS